MSSTASFFGHLFKETPAQYKQTPVQAAAAQGTANQYAAASQNPNFALPSIADQVYGRDQAINDVFNRVGASGGAGSGYANSLASKAAADYSLGLVKEQNTALSNLRGSMVQAAQPTQEPVPYQPDELTGIAQGLSRGAGYGLASRWFGDDQKGGMGVGA
jgi:hypothetical protein